ncbi:luciferase family protein [Streptomyces sp. NPDC051183]|uniref:luciferase domain-containing protein n=1 Tax=unclassified Streptomyces TaxID=2593676 RepID=UPI003420C0CA
MNTARHASEQLMSWSALSEGRPPCGAGLGLNAGSQEIVHFHGEHEADVHLTLAMIGKLRPALDRSTAVRLRSGSEWVTVRLDIGSDIDLLATLVSAALQAAAGGEDRGPDPCTRYPRYPSTQGGAGTGAPARPWWATERTGAAGRPGGTGPSAGGEVVGRADAVTDPHAGLLE